jgi:hypothetical protein
MIDCSGNKLDPDKGFNESSWVWCCTPLEKGGEGVKAYSTPQVPPAAHQLMQNVVGTIAAKPLRDSTQKICNMGKPVSR